MLVLLLLQDISAKRVASAVVLHVQQLGWAAQRNLDSEEEWQLIRQLMQDAGINVDGVVNQIIDRLDQVRRCMTQHFRRALLMWGILWVVKDSMN